MDFTPPVQEQCIHRTLQQIFELENEAAFLYAAITDAYASIDGGKSSGKRPQQHAADRDSENQEDRPTESQKDKCRRLPKHKEKVSAVRKRDLVRHRPEVNPDHFHRYRCAERPSEKQFIYFAPSSGGPAKPHRRRSKRKEVSRT